MVKDTSCKSEFVFRKSKRRHRSCTQAREIEIVNADTLSPDRKCYFLTVGTDSQMGDVIFVNRNAVLLLPVLRTP